MIDSNKMRVRNHFHKVLKERGATFFFQILSLIFNNLMKFIQISF